MMMMQPLFIHLQTTHGDLVTYHPLMAASSEQNGIIIHFSLLIGGFM
jgi:hypothetical protein